MNMLGQHNSFSHRTRVMNILKSAFFGLILVIGACILLFWAEGRAVKTALRPPNTCALKCPTATVS